MKQIALLIAGLLVAPIASASHLVLTWPQLSVTLTYTGTMTSVYEDEHGGHVIFAADGAPIWTDGSTDVLFFAGFEEMHWHVLVTMPPNSGVDWQTVDGLCAYSEAVDYTLTCR